MKIAVFGTGRYYERFKPLLKNSDILYFLDNDVRKAGKMIDGVRVILPEELDRQEVDMVLLLSIHYPEMETQLLGLGFPKHKIVNYFRIGKVLNLPAIVHGKNRDYQLEEWLSEKETLKKKRILLVGNGLSRTGAPVALLNMGKILKREGYEILFTGLKGGSLEEELRENGIDYISDISLLYYNDEFKKYISRFDLLILTCLGLINLVREYQDLNVPILWWLHETHLSYIGLELLEPNKNVRVFGGGNRVKRVFIEHFHTDNIEVMQYCIPEVSVSQRNRNEDKIVFALMGSICRRKAQDVYLNAIRLLSEEERSRMRFLIIGKEMAEEPEYYASYCRLLSEFPYVEAIGELSQEQLSEKFADIDVLVCPSREDPMPIVVTQAMMHSKVCIISNHVGQEEFIRQKENGMIFQSENAAALAKLMRWAAEHRDSLAEIGEQGRRIYEENFTEAIMESRLREILRDI